MGGDRTAVADEPTGGASQGRPPDHQRHHPRAQSGVPLAGLSGGLWPTDDDLQSLSSLGATRDLAATVCRTGDARSRRHPDDRQYHCQGTSFGGWRKRGAELQAIGRSRGGRTTKIHAVVDGCGRPIALEITPGQRGDAPIARSLLEPLPPSGLCAADAAYDSDRLRLFLIERGTEPVIPNNPTRKRLHPFDLQAYKLRNLIERMFCRLKDWRRIATRYDKLATNFAAAVTLAAIVIWWL
jgi:transposase